jgi:MFS family permease
MSVNCLAAIVAMPLLRYYGRRSLLIFTFLLCTVSLILVSLLKTQTGILIVMVIFIIMFEWGPGPIGWLYMSEVMNEKGVAVGTSINWTFTLIFGLLTTELFQ